MARLALSLFTTAIAALSIGAIAQDISDPDAIDQRGVQLLPDDLYEFFQCRVCTTPELHGSVEDSACDYETVDKAVTTHFRPLLNELSQLSFFRYYKVNLGKSCPFWDDDDGMCASIDCSVCACDDAEIPPKWYQLDKQRKKQARTAEVTSNEDMQACEQQTGESELSRVDRANAKAGENFAAWDEQSSADVWGKQLEDDEDMVYINLLENPERFTGYSGLQAERVWHAIYDENCFTPPKGHEANFTGMCLEERVYYRLISGLQSSINTHIALQYRFGDVWATNPALYVERVGSHPERLENLYFAYLFVMRALGRYREELLQYDFSTGNDDDDRRTVEILRKLVLDDEDHTACPEERHSVLTGFDEQALFRVQEGELSSDELATAQAQKKELEAQFRAKFQNVSRIMDCVTCEKCRLWGTIQTLGLGTAIKILLVDDVKNLAPLQRNELIALINVANNLSKSVDGVRLLRQQEFSHAITQFTLTTGLILMICLVGALILRKFRTKDKTE